jgi:hypothetical protein
VKHAFETIWMPPLTLTCDSHYALNYKKDLSSSGGDMQRDARRLALLISITAGGLISCNQGDKVDKRSVYSESSPTPENIQKQQFDSNDDFADIAAGLDEIKNGNNFFPTLPLCSLDPFTPSDWTLDISGENTSNNPIAGWLSSRNYAGIGLGNPDRPIFSRWLEIRFANLQPATCPERA